MVMAKNEVRIMRNERAMTMPAITAGLRRRLDSPVDCAISVAVVFSADIGVEVGCMVDDEEVVDADVLVDFSVNDVAVGALVRKMFV